MRSLLAVALIMLATLGAMAQDWLAVRETTLEVAPGSPLDFSTILPNGPINAQRLIIIANGRFAMSDAPDQPAPLLCASLTWSPSSGGFLDHDGADVWSSG
ncbi:MAG: hypothetical protein MO852_04360 [Candidatus Devosia euplotis]|nr:hypothetical protein [Candidatus Devosia euplotis]